MHIISHRLTPATLNFTADAVRSEGCNANMTYIFYHYRGPWLYRKHYFWHWGIMCRFVWLGHHECSLAVNWMWVIFSASCAYSENTLALFEGLVGEDAEIATIACLIMLPFSPRKYLKYTSLIMQPYISSTTPTDIRVYHPWWKEYGSS